jgi:hypothetical protein
MLKKEIFLENRKNPPLKKGSLILKKGSLLLKRGPFPLKGVSYP